MTQFSVVIWDDEDNEIFEPTTDQLAYVAELIENGVTSSLN